MLTDIHTLSPETLTQIFEHFIYLNATVQDRNTVDTLAAQQRRSMMAIAHTCRRWRRTLYSTPTLWTYIHIIPREPIVNHAKLCLSLSGNLPVTIFYHTWPQHHNENGLLFDIIGSMERVQKLIIYMAWTSKVVSPQDQTKTDAPLLEELTIIDTAPTGSTPNLPDFSFMSSPRLRHVDISAWAPRLFRRNFATLTSLIIRLPTGYISDLTLPFTQCLLAAPHQLEELFIVPNRQQGKVPSGNQPLFKPKSSPVISFPRLRKFILAWFSGDSKLLPLLTALKIPDMASRQILSSLKSFTIANNPCSLQDRIILGRMQQAPCFPIIRKLHILDIQSGYSSSGYQMPDRYIAIDGDTLTLNPMTTRIADFSTLTLSDVVELNVISMIRQPARFTAKIVLPVLSGLRKLTLSTDGITNAMKPIADVLCQRTTMDGETLLPLVCPVLEEVGLYFYDPLNRPRNGLGQEIIEDGASLLVLAQERKRRRAILEAVTFERCGPDLERSLLECVTKRVTPIRRWAGYPGGYFKDEIVERHEWCRGI